MEFKRIVVIGTSSGGIESLRMLAGALPPDFPAPLCIVMHLAPESPGVLHDILQRAGPLEAVSPRQGERLRRGTIYVAPPDRHLIVEPGQLRLTKAPRENRFRPAVDPLFRSAAQSYGPATIGVILTGNLDDGTAGLAAPPSCRIPTTRCSRRCRRAQLPTLPSITWFPSPSSRGC